LEVHSQFGEIRTVKDFLVRLALIVAGVVIAVTVTQCREKSQRNALAEQMRGRIAQEITDNSKALESAAKRYEQSLASLTTASATCKTLMQSKLVDASLVKQIENAKIDLRTPPLSSTQWTLALSNQSLREFSVEDASKFAKLYALQKGIEEVFIQHKPGVMAALVETETLNAAANTEEIGRTCRALSLLQHYAASSAGNMKALLDSYQKAGFVVAPEQ
jgi:hypothetical protein